MSRPLTPFARLQTPRLLGYLSLSVKQIQGAGKSPGLVERDSSIKPSDVKQPGTPELAMDIGSTVGEDYMYSHMKFGDSGDDASNDDETGGQNSYESLNITRRVTGFTIHQLSKNNAPPRCKVQLVSDDLPMLRLMGIPLSSITNTTADCPDPADIEQF